MKKRSRKAMRRFKIGLVAIFSVVLLVFSTASVISCGIVEIIKPEGTIIGIVNDAETSEPIPGVLMTLAYHETVRTELTDAKGQYVFTNVPLCFCLKNISAQKRGYESQYQLVAVSGITYVNFSLKPIDNNDEPTNGVITGIVTDAKTNQPISNALMTLKYHDIIRTELTDLKGQYTFTEVPICFCLKNVSASKKGYESQYQLVAVSEVTYVNFSLNPVADDNQDANSIISGETREKGAPIESNSYCLAIIGVVGAVITILIGINVYLIRRTNRTKK